VSLLDLTVDQVGQHLPFACAVTNDADPLTEVGRQRVEVQVQPITGENRQAARGKPETQVMDDGMRCHLGPRAKVQHRDEFGQWVERHPQPEDVCSITEACPEFIELEVWEREVPNPAVVQGGAVLTRT
jgi:hypothetical protein